MSAEAEHVSSKGDAVKWVLVAVLVAGAVYGNHYFAEQPMWMRLAGILVVLALAFFVAAKTTKGHTALTFAKEARVEIRKVVWPTRQETVQTTLIIVLFVAIVAGLLWGLDSILNWLVKWVIG